MIYLKLADRIFLPDLVLLAGLTVTARERIILINCVVCPTTLVEYVLILLNFGLNSLFKLMSEHLSWLIVSVSTDMIGRGYLVSMLKIYTSICSPCILK